MLIFGLRFERSVLIAISGLATLTFLFFGTAQIHATPVLQYVSDLVTTSNPATSTNHTITFRVVSAIPPSGRIVITPDPDSFTIPSDLDYADVDLATSSALSGSYIDRVVAVSPNASADGVSVISGTSGSITLTLQSSQGIAASTFVRIRIGTHAIFGASGDSRLVNPTSTEQRSYHIRFRTEDSGGSVLDEGSTLVAILPAIDLVADTLDFDPPVRTNGMPSGTIPAGVRFVEISLNTDEDAVCKYATSSGISYSLMPNTFSSTGDTTLHLTVVSTPNDNETYTYYVRCVDRIPNENTDDYPIAFTIQNTPLPAGAGGPLASPGAGGGGPPYLPQPASPYLTLSGFAYPAAAISVLKDGAAYQKTTANSNAGFSVFAGEVAQGTYTFSTFATDNAGRRSSAYTTTFTIVKGTRNLISGILVPPTIALDTETVAPGGVAEVRGQSAPNARVEVQVSRQMNGPVPDSEIKTLVTTSTPSGDWSASIDTKSFATATYLVRARSVVPDVGTSPMSLIAYLGVGKTPAAGACGRSDLNFDSKVNLVDFSILLFHWGTTDEIGDLNNDGKVNLTDFSILLFCWTG